MLGFSFLSILCKEKRLLSDKEIIHSMAWVCYGNYR
ncbi:hypothetical protein VAA_03471 [Vibrio anguillarum 775]|nr:hypothetical protein VAA_03471 [Vibrio anguillarum 775]